MIFTSPPLLFSLCPLLFKEHHCSYCYNLYLCCGWKTICNIQIAVSKPTTFVGHKWLQWKIVTVEYLELCYYPVNRVVSPFIWAEKLSDWYFCAIIFLGPIQVCNVFIFGQFRVLLCFVQTVKKKWLSTQILCKFSFLAHYMFFSKYMETPWKTCKTG